MQDEKDSNFYEMGTRTDAFAASIAFILTVLVHVCVIAFVPYTLKGFSEKNKTDEFSVEILPPQIDRSKPEFVEANPYGNSDVPVSPNAPESFKDQRAADVVTDADSTSKMPYVEGEIKNGRKIVSGTSSPEDVLSPQEVISVTERPLVRPAQPQDMNEETSDSKSEASKSEKDGSEGGRKSETDGKSEEGSDEKSDSEKTAISKSETELGKLLERAPIEGETGDTKDANSVIKIPARIKNADSAKMRDKPDNAPKGDAEKTSSATAKKSSGDGRKAGDSGGSRAEKKPLTQERAESVPAPKPRPQLSMKIPAGPLADNRSHASKQGLLAVDSRFSEFGAYQQRMIEAISRQWNLLGSKYDLGTAIGTQTVIEYWLDNKGNLVRHKILFSNSTNTGRGLCEQSILTTAPYGEWTRDMINTLGTGDQSVTITFHYR